jgi:predicted DNA-binding transcriptional regulator YafY
MRADRLIAMILYLQSHPRATADTLAMELEVSVRTIYRDLQALSSAGVPVYAERGVGGGIHLVEDYRTDLSGLSSEEVSALMLLNLPEALRGLETGQKLKSALIKLTSAMRQRSPTAPARQRIYLDWAGWGQGDGQKPFLPLLYQAANEDRYATLEYIMMNGMTVTRKLAIYGLVAKAGQWYVVFMGNGRMQWQSLLNLVQVALSEEHFERQEQFDLAEYWQQVSREVEKSRLPFKAILRGEKSLSGFYRQYFREVGLAEILRLQEMENGQVELEVAFAHLESARTQVLGLGVAVEVVAPLELRESVRLFAETISEKYQQTY